MKGPCEQCLVFSCCKNKILNEKKNRWAASYLIDRLMAECPELNNYLINTNRDKKVVKYIFTLFGLPYSSDWNGDVLVMIRYMHEWNEKDKIVKMILIEKKSGDTRHR